MAAVYQHPQPVWPQVYHPAQYRSGYSTTHATPARYSRNVDEARSSRRDHERRESLRRADQIRTDEELAARVQEQEEQLLIFDSMRTAQRNRHAHIEVPRHRIPSTSSRSSTPISHQSRRPASPAIEPFIPPLPEPLSTPSTSLPRRVRIASPVVSDAPAAYVPQASSASASDPARDLRKYTDLFTRSPPCSRCGTQMTVQPMVDISLGKQLHLTCGECSTIHCRGCVKPVDCGPRCNAFRKECRLRTCCRKGRAIAIFEILGLFDKEYAAAAEHSSTANIWPVPQSHREDFLEFITSNSDNRASKHFNKSFIETLEAVLSWLPHEKSIHSSVPLLLSTSFLLEVVHAYLKNDTRAHVNWVVYAELYNEIMNLLTLLGRHESHRNLVIQNLPCINTSSGLQSWLWDELSEWTADVGSIRESLYSVASAPSIRDDLTKMERRPDALWGNLISDLLTDWNHIALLNVLI